MSTKLDWSDVRRRLLALMREVGAEISAYPRPITACDAQFNHLLELRRMLPAELARLHEHLARAAGGERQFLFVTGEAGIGKTRVVDAFLASVAETAPAELARLEAAVADPSTSVEAFIRGSPCRDALCAVEPATGG